MAKSYDIEHLNVCEDFKLCGIHIFSIENGKFPYLSGQKGPSWGNFSLEPYITKAETS